MANAITKRNSEAQQIESVMIGGDLSSLTAEQRVTYYNQVCDSLGLNPLTRPFDYIKLQGKLTLYARRDAADQLRKVNGISLGKPEIEYADDVIIVSIDARDRNGRTDSDVGVVSIATLKGEAKANAIMKAITKAKRRVTLSIAGLGFSDETEVETIPGAEYVVVSDTGEIVDRKALTKANGNANGTHAEESFDNPWDGDDTPSKPKATPAQLAEIDELGRQVYGDQWSANIARLAQWASTGIASRLEDLLEAEAVKAIGGLKKKMPESEPA